MNEIQTVHLIFKTHLDIGFTDFARNVVATYFDVFIPKAIATAATLRQGSDRDRYVWTTGSWLIYEYLETASAEDRRRLENAIEAGDIAWHGLPFTTHSELMDASLFRYGLSLSQELDRRFGKQTIAAKMTDVPGHTRAIVPLLAEAGIQFLHIGVNSAATAPDVPPVFVWQDESGAEIIVMYHNNYGAEMFVPGTSAALAFAYAKDERGDSDNFGPHSVEQVFVSFAEVRRSFPDAHVLASTLDAYASELLPAKPSLPVIREEIGDTWIHGIGTDPKKVSQFRDLCRLRNQWLADRRVSPHDAALRQFSRSLIMVPEHTWGLDEKTHLADYENYGKTEFARARHLPNFRKMEASWAEQRGYLSNAVQALGDSELHAEANDCLNGYAPTKPEMVGYEELPDAISKIETEYFFIRFDESSGAISHLVDKRTGISWAARDHLLGLVRYQTFSQADYDRYLGQYLTSRPEWAILDNSKPGIDLANAQSGWWSPKRVRSYYGRDEYGERFLWEVMMEPTCTVKYGCPELFTVEFDLPGQQPIIDIRLQWFGKPASRLPEAIWFSFQPKAEDRAGWRLDKMDASISPLGVVRNGNRKLHAVGKGVHYRAGEHQFAIETLDTPLVAPGEPSLLEFENESPPLENGMHFNLYNNVWGTNFPMWYDEDALFRFRLKFPDGTTIE